MKRVLKVIVPVLLGIAILLSIGWYLFEYDPDFTRDVLLQQARYLENNGNHGAAVWFYELAYRQSKDNDDVAMELAEQFKAIGNYSKAESTLSKAIQDGGSVELYIALCQTFVEQNKLLDAVQMLSNVGNHTIKAALEEMRPAPPTASTDSGFYSQYLNIELSSGSGKVYYSTDGEYPSLHTDAYLSPISLSGGETTLFALTVDENGLVSTPAVFQYTIGGVIEEVTFQDSAIEAALRQQLGISTDRAIYSNELWNVTEFTMPASAISPEDLQWLPYLNSLTIESNTFDSLAVLGQLPKLKTLTMSGCGLSTISHLAEATGLTYLDLSNNSIRDIQILSNMKNLEELNLSHNAVVSLSDLAFLYELRILDASYNSVASTAPIFRLSSLEKLDVSHNGLMQLEGVRDLTGLREFSASGNNLVEVDALSGCFKLEKLDISSNTILNIDFLSSLVKLQELNFSNNEISELPDLQNVCNLTTINGSYNLLTSLDPLGELAELQYVYMDYNEQLRSINVLTNCAKLVIVNVYGTQVSNVKALTDMGVVVNYNPV